MKKIESDKIMTAVALYQRQTDKARVDDIAANFDERIANEPKVSFRDGRYFVFDGQHTIMARIKRNGGKHLPILCKVYYNLTAEDEAYLFATQTGFSSKLTPGEKLRARAFSNDRTSLDFIEANNLNGVDVSLSSIKGSYRLRCIGTAFNEFRRLGYEKYFEAIKVICDSWNGISSSFRLEIVVGVCRFVNLYDGEYTHEVLVRELGSFKPNEIVAEVEKDESLSGINRYLNWIFNLYNERMSSGQLEKKF